MSLSAAARRKTRLFRYAWILQVCLVSPAFLVLVAPAGASPQARSSNQEIITRILFDGNRRIQSDTLRSRIFSRAGDPFNEETARRDFQALWNTQYFEDIRLEVEDDPKVPNGKVLIFKVQERPIIRRIEYKGNKSVSESDILDRFKERKVGLTVESQFDPTRITRAQVVLKELLAEHGRQFAKVKPTYERIAATNAVKLVFNIDEGPKVKVGKILITGNHAFSSRRIIRSMRNSRPAVIPLWFTEIPIYHKTFDKNKLNEDTEAGIRALYQDNGYFRVIVKDPILNTVNVDRNGIPGPWPLVGREHGKATNITIPIEEGDRYHMGKLIIRSSDPDQPLFVKSEYLQNIFPLKQGDVFSTAKVRKSFDMYRDLYGQYGFIDFTINPITDPDTATKTVSLTLEFDQQKQFIVRRIEFSGNTTTRDKVIRREVLIDEGQLFNKRYWELSILRLNQLDYFDPIKPENAELKRNIKEGTVDILLKVKEKGKQSISFTGGVSGLAGSFIGLSYQTNNFLGLGETLTFSAQFGDLQRSLLFGFTEPYLFDRPISTGFTVFSNRYDYNQSRQTSILLGQQVAINPAFEQNYNQSSKGFTLFASYPMRRFAFTRVGLTYGFSTTDITAFSQSSQLLFETLQFTSLGGPSALKGIRSSKITPTISYSSLNGGENATSGHSFSVSVPFEGGPLQGNVNTVAGVFTGSWYHPVNKKRNVVAVHFITAMVTGYGGKVVPPFTRFYLGGENDVRGFDFYTISPWAFIPTTSTQSIGYFDPTKLDSSGNPTRQALNVPVLSFVATRPGGDTQAVGNLEYRIPIVGPTVELDLFTDAGIDGALRKSQLQLDSAAVNLLNEQYPNPDFPNLKISQQIQVAPGTNFTPRVSSGIQIVVQLPIVHAPFRFYYAYNVSRLADTIVQPRGAFFLSDETKAALPPGVYQTQILPALNTILDQQAFRIPSSLFEPKSMYRFTVSRTF